MSLNTLKDVREKLLGYRSRAAADFSGIAHDRLLEIEGGDAPSVFEAEMLARVYGIDADLLVEQPVRLAAGDGVETLALMEEFRELDDSMRLRIVSTANAARDLARLKQQMSDTRATPTKVHRLSNFRSNFSAHLQGAEHADELRRGILPRGRRDEPIASMRDFVANAFPAIMVLYARLGGSGPSGIAFNDALRGTTIILNLDGKNENPLVRRFSLAHELYHILVDRTGPEPLATISGYLNERGLERERRANAFAARLLCPQSKLHSLRRMISPEEAARKLEGFGLSYGALRLYLHNEADLELPREPPQEFVGAGTEPKWTMAEEPIGIANFPLGEVAPERRTHIARTAAQLYSMRKIRRGTFVDLLGVTPLSDVERVLDFFALDQPVVDA